MYDSIFGVFLYFAIPKVSNMVPKHGLGGRIRANLIPNHPQDPFFYRSPHAHRVCRRLPPIAFPLFSRGSAHRHRRLHLHAFASRLHLRAFATRRRGAVRSRGSHRARGRRPHRCPSRVRHRNTRGLFFTRGDDLRPPAGVVFPRALPVEIWSARGSRLPACPVLFRPWLFIPARCT
jgi:hypothetical protein